MPVSAVLLCWVMILPVVIDVLGSAAQGRMIPAFILGGYALLEVLVYVTYGLRASRRLELQAKGPQIGRQADQLDFSSPA